MDARFSGEIGRGKKKKATKRMLQKNDKEVFSQNAKKVEEREAKWETGSKTQEMPSMTTGGKEEEGHLVLWEAPKQTQRVGSEKVSNNKKKNGFLRPETHKIKQKQ